MQDPMYGDMAMQRLGSHHQLATPTNSMPQPNSSPALRASSALGASLASNPSNPSGRSDMGLGLGMEQPSISFNPLQGKSLLDSFLATRPKASSMITRL